MFRGSSAVEQVAVNHQVVGSNPTPGAILDSKRQETTYNDKENTMFWIGLVAGVVAGVILALVCCLVWVNYNIKDWPV